MKFREREILITLAHTPSLTCILGLLNVDLNPVAQSATVWTHLFTT
jgi:hypothetical protein